MVSGALFARIDLSRGRQTLSLPLAVADGRALSLLSDNPIGLILMTLPPSIDAKRNGRRKRCINCAVDSLITHARSTAVSSHVLFQHLAKVTDAAPLRITATQK